VYTGPGEVMVPVGFMGPGEVAVSVGFMGSGKVVVSVGTTGPGGFVVVVMIMGPGTSGELVGTEGPGDIVGPLGIMGPDRPTGVLIIVEFVGAGGGKDREGSIPEVMVVNVAGEESGGGADGIVGRDQEVGWVSQGVGRCRSA
jgi:hypothetical protein